MYNRRRSGGFWPNSVWSFTTLSVLDVVNVIVVLMVGAFAVRDAAAIHVARFQHYLHSTMQRSLKGVVAREALSRSRRINLFLVGK